MMCNLPIIEIDPSEHSVFIVVYIYIYIFFNLCFEDKRPSVQLQLGREFKKKCSQFVVHCAECLESYRPCACVGVVRLLYSQVYDFLHTHRYFVGQ